MGARVGRCRGYGAHREENPQPGLQEGVTLTHHNTEVLSSYTSSIVVLSLLEKEGQFIEA